MKNLGFLIFTSILLVLSASTRAELATVTLPNLSLIKAATFIEVIRALGEENSKTFLLCHEDATRRLQGQTKPLKPACRSELNRILTQDQDSRDESVISLAYEITKNAKTDLEKAAAIHDWVTQNISYDVATYTAIVKEHKLIERPMQLISAKAVLLNKISVAEGYALLTAALLRAVNIPAVTIAGVALLNDEVQGPHAWNEAFVEGRWINLDTTWDSGGVNGNLDEGLTFVKNPSRRFFDTPDAEFKKTHRALIDIR